MLLEVEEIEVEVELEVEEILVEVLLEVEVVVLAAAAKVATPVAHITPPPVKVAV